MLYTDCDTHCPWDWCPLAMANGIEWSVMRRSCLDRFDNLYREGTVNRLLWMLGAFAGCFYTPKWLKKVDNQNAKVDKKES